jgi:hypothetical protein
MNSIAEVVYGRACPINGSDRCNLRKAPSAVLPAAAGEENMSPAGRRSKPKVLVTT